MAIARSESCLEILFANCSHGRYFAYGAHDRRRRIRAQFRRTICPIQHVLGGAACRSHVDIPLSRQALWALRSLSNSSNRALPSLARSLHWSRRSDVYDGSCSVGSRLVCRLVNYVSQPSIKALAVGPNGKWPASDVKKHARYGPLMDRSWV
jgi:hypothetical protein